MADLRESLETELARQLCPISAPDSLWHQIHQQRRPLRVRPHPWTKWSIAAAALLMLLAGLVWRLGATRGPSEDLEMLAGRELRGVANGSGRIDIRSSDPGEIQRWVKAKLDVDVRLPGNEAVRLLGARVIRLERLSIAAITFRVGDEFAAMLVTGRQRSFTGSTHASLRIRSAGDMLLYSWSVGREDYAMAFGDTSAPKQPCLLCHASPPALILFR